MNEIAVAGTNNAMKFNNYNLTVKTGQIFNALRDNNRNSLKVAGLLSEIHDNNLFMDDYESYEAYAQQVFGLKKAQAYNLANVGKYWVARDEKGKVVGESVLPHSKDYDWTTTKLLTLQQQGITPADAMRMCDSEIISADLSVSKLKTAIKDWKESLPGSDDEADTDESDEKPDEANHNEKPDESGENAGTDKPEETAQKRMMDLITFAVKQAAGIMEEASERGVITEESRAAWVSAMNAINQGYNALAALVTNG